MFEAVITAGSLIVVALIGVVGSIAVAKINTLGKKVDTTIQQTHATSNGYAEHTKDRLAEIVDRLDDQDRARRLRDRHMNLILAKFDDRLIHIEENITNE